MLSKKEIKHLVIGVGNDQRGDDALGWAFVRHIEAAEMPYTVVFRYQLQVEDAELVSHFDEVVIVDATHRTLASGFEWYEVKPSDSVSFSTHQQSPESLLYLCQTVFQNQPTVSVLAICGDVWELGEPLSTVAQKNLERAWASFLNRN